MSTNHERNKDKIYNNFLPEMSFFYKQYHKIVLLYILYNITTPGCAKAQPGVHVIWWDRLVRCEDHVHVTKVAQTVTALVGGLPGAATHEAARCCDLLHFGGGISVLEHALLVGSADANSRTFRDLLSQSEIFHQKLGLNICFFQTNHFLFKLLRSLR